MLTDYTKKEYQHELLGIDEEKERKKKLFHLLFFYEASKAGQISFLGDQQFDDFLKSLSLTRDDLKVSNIETDDISESFIRYQSLKGIEISKYERRGPPSNAAIRERLEELGIADKDIILYNVTIPGFSIEEIFQYHQKNINKQKLASSTPLPAWVSPEEHESSVYSPHALGIFSHIEFGYGEIKRVLTEFEKVDLIRQISFSNVRDTSKSDITKHKRFILADERILTLSGVVWELYREKLSTLEIRHHSGQFSSEDISMLRYLFGDENVGRIIRGWKLDQRLNEENEDSKEGNSKPDKEIRRGLTQIDQIKHNMLVQLLIKKYKTILQQYDLLDLVSRMLFY